MTTFIRATQRDVYHFLTHLCGREVAEDLTQETYLRVLPGFAGRSSARTWLLSIARRVAADDIRRASARVRTSAVEDRDVVVAADPALHRSGWEEGAAEDRRDESSAHAAVAEVTTE